MLACRVDVNTRTKNALERTLTLLIDMTILFGVLLHSDFSENILLLQFWSAELLRVCFSFGHQHIYTVYTYLYVFLYM